MNATTNKEKLLDLYTLACRKKLCVSKGEFAELIGVSRQTLSSAMNGEERYATDKLIARAEAAVNPIIVSMDNSGDAHDNVQKNFGTPDGTDEPKSTEISEIVKTLTDELAKERESHERIMLALIQKIGQ